MSLAASYFRGASQGAVVAAVSACNGLGLTAEQSWAFWRAELSPFVESPFVCDNGERATMCLDRTIPVKVSGIAREAALIRRALAALQADLAPLRGLRVGVGLATSARHPPAPAAVARELDRVLGAAPALQLLPLGPAAFGRAVAEAASALAGGTLDAALVGAVDTAYDVERAAALLEEGRLFDGEHPEAPIHGEGAAFLLLLRPDVATRLRSPALATLEGAVLDEEALPADAPVDGAGLTRALRAHTAVLKKARAPLEWILADVNNEERRTREWVLALPRALAPGGLSTAGKDYVEVASPRLRTDFLPVCFGDLGAAAIPTALVVAVTAAQHGDPAARNVLAVGSDARARRGAVLLSLPFRKENG